MSERKTGIPKTSIYNRLNIFRWDIRDSLFDQMDWGLYYSGLDMVDAMILDEVNRVTHISLDANCIRDIMELL